LGTPWRHPVEPLLKGRYRDLEGNAVRRAFTKKRWSAEQLEIHYSPTGRFMLKRGVPPSGEQTAALKPGVATKE
jgi:hypothetical protein